MTHNPTHNFPTLIFCLFLVNLSYIFFHTKWPKTGSEHVIIARKGQQLKDLLKMTRYCSNRGRESCHVYDSIKTYSIELDEELSNIEGSFVTSLGFIKFLDFICKILSFNKFILRFGIFWKQIVEKLEKW